MSKDERCNGWTNRETWTVNLWLTNEESTYHESRALTRNAEGVFAAADALESYVDDLVDEASGFQVDLLRCALGRVNWREIAQDLMED